MQRLFRVVKSPSRSARFGEARRSPPQIMNSWNRWIVRMYAAIDICTSGTGKVCVPRYRRHSIAMSKVPRGLATARGPQDGVGAEPRLVGATVSSIIIWSIGPALGPNFHGALEMISRYARPLLPPCPRYRPLSPSRVPPPHGRRWKLRTAPRAPSSRLPHPHRLRPGLPRPIENCGRLFRRLQS